MDAFLDAVGEGFAVLVLEGEAGIGKTTVWREARRRAQERGALVLTCRPSPAETKFSFSGVGDLLGPLDDGVFAKLPDPQREALDVALLRKGPSGRGPVSRAAAAGFLSVIRGLAATQEVVLAVDDWQWLDPPSRAVLEFTARRLESERVGLLCSVRSPVSGLLVGGAVTGERLRRVAVGPLSLAALGRIVGARLGRSLPRPLVVRIAQATGGNPFYALEVARLLLEQGAERGPGLGLPVPDDLRRLAASRISRLPEDTREAVLLASVLSSPNSSCVDVDALGPAEEEEIVAVDEVGRVEFAHPLFAAGAADSMPLARRRELHRRAAAVVSDAEQRARHLALGSERPDTAVASQLDEAAVLAAGRGAPEAAAELSEMAAAQTPAADSHARGERLLSAARFHLHAGDLARAEALAAKLMAATGPDAVRAPVLQLAAQLAARRSDFTQAAGFASAALEAAADDRVRAGIELELVYCSVSVGDLTGAVSHARSAAAHAQAAGEQGMLADALAVLTMAEFLCGRGVAADRLKRAIELEDPLMTRSPIMRPRVIQGMLQLWTGELDAALDTFGALSAAAVEHGQEGFAPLLSLYRVWSGVWQGDLDQAARWSEEARAAADLLEDPTASGLALAASALVHSHDGRTDLTRAEAGEAIALFERLQWRSGLIWPLWALGLAELSDGNPSGVDAVLGPLADQFAATGGGDPVLSMFLPDEIEALIALGELDRAQAYLEPFERSSRELDRAWALAVAERCRGALEGARGESEAAFEAFEHALTQHDRVEMPFERARTLLLAGQGFRRFKQRGRAREMLEEALAEFGRIGAPQWAERARGELARVGGRARSGDELTATEQRIAELAASGLSNREVAERAFVSIKTVEASLTRAYRKLGVRSRTSLATALAAEAPVPEEPAAQP